jgi:hypothetical protein
MIPSRAAEDEALVVIQKGPPLGFRNLQRPAGSYNMDACIILPQKEMVWMGRGNNNLSTDFIIYSLFRNRNRNTHTRHPYMTLPDRLGCW